MWNLDEKGPNFAVLTVRWPKNFLRLSTMVNDIFEDFEPPFEKLLVTSPNAIQHKISIKFLIEWVVTQPILKNLLSKIFP